MSNSRLVTIYFHCGNERGLERARPAVPRIGEIVITEFCSMIVSEVHWDDDPIGLPYVHVHLEPRPNAEK